MDQIVIPDDGLVFTKSDGTPVLQISFVNDAAILTLVSATQQSKVVLACDDSEGGVLISNGQKSIQLTANLGSNEIRLRNGDGNVTHLIHTTETGGQIDLCDAEANPLISMGPNSNDGDAGLFLRNSKEESVVTLLSINGDGNILVTKGGRYCWSANDLGR